MRRCFCQDWPEEAEEEQSSDRTPDPDQFSYWSTDHESDDVQAVPHKGAEAAEDEWPEDEDIENPGDAGEVGQDGPWDEPPIETGDERQELWRACLLLRCLLVQLNTGHT